MGNLRLIPLMTQFNFVGSIIWAFSGFLSWTLTFSCFLLTLISLFIPLQVFLWMYKNSVSLRFFWSFSECTEAVYHYPSASLLGCSKTVYHYPSSDLPGQRCICITKIPILLFTIITRILCLLAEADIQKIKQTKRCTFTGLSRFYFLPLFYQDWRNKHTMNH